MYHSTHILSGSLKEGAGCPGFQFKSCWLLGGNALVGCTHFQANHSFTLQD